MDWRNECLQCYNFTNASRRVKIQAIPTLQHENLKRRSIYYLLALCSAILLAAPFLFPVLFPVTWVSLIPLLWLLQRVSVRQALLFGLGVGGVMNLLGFYWLNYTIRVFGGFPHGLSEIIWLGFAVYAALPVALFSLLVRFYGLGPLGLFPALFWVTIEFWFPLLFPWHLANSQSYFLTLIQSADLIGPYGTSFVLVWVNSVLYQIGEGVFVSKSRKRIPVTETTIVGAVLAGFLVYGHARLAAVSTEMEAAPAITVAAVQGNISIRTKGNLTYLQSNLASYKDLTSKIQGAQLVVWPESAVEAWVPQNMKRLPPQLPLPLPPGVSFLIFGVRSLERDAATSKTKVFNSAFLVDREGQVVSRYHKQTLLAFGEYVPLTSVLSLLPGMPPIGQGFSRGDGPRTLDLSSTIRLAPLICYEDLMPWLSRRFVAASHANLLVNLTNDGWFGNTVAPWQHARLSQWRAIETRRSLVRATNTGVTTVINPRGEILESLPVYSTGVLNVKVPLMKSKTFYVRFGDWFTWVATAASLSIVIIRQLFHH